MKRRAGHRIRHDSKAVSCPATGRLFGLAVAIACGLTAASLAARAIRANRAGRPAAQGSTATAERQLAEKDAEVGRFYLRIGKYDAAISRFRSSIAHDPGWAEPHELLGEAYEKESDPKSAIAQYREYLKIAPRAKDGGKVEKRVEQLLREEKARDSEGR